jgi:hypothetical protein
VSEPLLERTVRESVTFDRPFRVDGTNHQQPAGTYTIETIEELIEGLSFLAYRRVATSIVLPLPSGGAASYQLVPIDPNIVRAVRGPRRGSRS